MKIMQWTQQLTTEQEQFRNVRLDIVLYFSNNLLINPSVGHFEIYIQIHKTGQSRELKINYENTEARYKTPRLSQRMDILFPHSEC
ncbi:hypothetical protein M514_06102 [Trichuris suis]|uniref:Uncharacterized protein n=1 Tax=Trichuris suis TaxID=68888 RepID=A0A085M6Z0_9BILA|nr:hypothetical protein M513_06102 [Trichuris suis]KFD69883.1 hypothetical protein M514_06102 [Trichuris suis]